eukprot:GHVP01054702.1.p1 GENE.GHVP01054702.1~~GHVP01054702.1.p1  ORF type:complete len:224 (+),score=44.14 GHVP01054702.1:55-726(+)
MDAVVTKKEPPATTANVVKVFLQIVNEKRALSGKPVLLYSTKLSDKMKYWYCPQRRNTHPNLIQSPEDSSVLSAIVSGSTHAAASTAAIAWFDQAKPKNLSVENPDFNSIGVVAFIDRISGYWKIEAIATKDDTLNKQEMCNLSAEASKIRKRHESNQKKVMQLRNWEEKPNFNEMLWATRTITTSGRLINPCDREDYNYLKERRDLRIKNEEAELRYKCVCW